MQVPETATDPATDLAAIERLTAAFFAAFTSGATTALDRMPELFLPRALIVRTCGGEPTCYTVAEFIEPRRRLLNDGSLLEFSEWETGGHTELYGDIAQRFGGYAKSGVQNGIAFEGKGMKSIQFVRTPDGWRISAVAWDDER
jgi:hypothetical protein